MQRLTCPLNTAQHDVSDSSLGDVVHGPVCYIYIYNIQVRGVCVDRIVRSLVRTGRDPGAVIHSDWKGDEIKILVQLSSCERKFASKRTISV